MEYGGKKSFFNNDGKKSTKQIMMKCRLSLKGQQGTQEIMIGKECACIVIIFCHLILVLT